MYLLCLNVPYWHSRKAFVRKFSVRSVSHVNILQKTYNQLTLRLMFLAEKCNLQPTLLHYKKLARHLVIQSKMLMVLALQPIGFNKYIFIIIDIQQFYISYRLPIP